MSRIKSNLPRVLGTVAAVTLSAMVGGQAWAQEIAIGAVVPSSGPFAEWGRSNTVTLKMLEQQTNDAGGINGAKLKITILDDAAKPAQAASSLRKLAGDEKVLAVAGPLTSSAAEVTFPVANEMKVVSTSQASSKPGVAKLNRPWAFRNTIDEGVLAKTTVPFYKKAFNIKTVAVIFDAKDATASTVGKVIMPAVLKANDITVANENDLLSFNTGDLDVSAQVTKLKALNPDGVVVSADYSQAITVLREMKRQGLIKPVVGATQLISSAILKAAPEIPVIAPATFYATMTGPAPEKFTATLTPLLRKESGLPKDIEPHACMTPTSTRSSRCISTRSRRPASPASRPISKPTAPRSAITLPSSKASPVSAARSASMTTATRSRPSMCCRARTAPGTPRSRAAARRPATRPADLPHHPRRCGREVLPAAVMMTTT